MGFRRTSHLPCFLGPHYSPPCNYRACLSLSLLLRTFAFQNDMQLYFMEQIHRSGKPWGVIAGFLERELPDTLEDRGEVAFHLVREAFDRIFGTEDEGWHTFKRPNRDGKQITWIKAGKPEAK